MSSEAGLRSALKSGSAPWELCLIFDQTSPDCPLPTFISIGVKRTCCSFLTSFYRIRRQSPGKSSRLDSLDLLHCLFFVLQHLALVYRFLPSYPRLPTDTYTHILRSTDSTALMGFTGSWTQLSLARPMTLLVVLAIVLSHAAVLAAPTTSQYFQLQTHVTKGCASKNNLWLSPYHTGAGTADAVLLRSPNNETAWYLNGTQIELASTTNPGYQTWLYMEFEDSASWSPVTIDQTSGPSAGGFYFNGTHSPLRWNPEYPEAGPGNASTDYFKGWYGKFKGARRRR